MSEIKPVAWIVRHIMNYEDELSFYPDDEHDNTPLYGPSALAQARAEERERVRNMAHKALTRYRHHRAMGAIGDAMDTLEDCVTLFSRIRALSDTDERK